MARPSRIRPGLQPVTNLPEDMRRVLEPMVDVMSRMTGASTLGKLGQLSTLDLDFLLGTATTADQINRINQIHFALNTTIAFLNAVVARIQED